MKAPRPLLLPRKSCLRGVPVSTVDNCSIHRKQYLPCILDNEPQVVLVRKFDGVLDVENRLRRNADNRDVPLFAGQAERRLHSWRQWGIAVDTQPCIQAPGEGGRRQDAGGEATEPAPYGIS